jgi:hypothetical protein
MPVSTLEQANVVITLRVMRSMLSPQYSRPNDTAIGAQASFPALTSNRQAEPAGAQR